MLFQWRFIDFSLIRESLKMKWRAQIFIVIRYATPIKIFSRTFKCNHQRVQMSKSDILRKDTAYFILWYIYAWETCTHTSLLSYLICYKYAVFSTKSCVLSILAHMFILARVMQATRWHKWVQLVQKTTKRQINPLVALKIFIHWYNRI